MSIRRIIESIIDVEGGFVDHSDDLGGPTCYGITLQTARGAGYTGNMRDLPRHLAYSIYELKYYRQPKFDHIHKRSEAVAEELTDTGINMGPSVAATFLQRCLNVLNRQAGDYRDIKADGDIGAATLAALDGFIAVRGDDGLLVLLTMLNALQGARYIKLCEARQKNETFVYGWFRHRVTL